MSRPRVSLRTFMVIVLIVGAGLGSLVVRAREQRDIVAAIRRAGGRIAYDWEWKDGLYQPSKNPWWPDWLVNRLGPDFLASVKEITLVAGKPDQVNDDLMARVGRLRGLESIMINGCPGVTDAGMIHIRGLSNLTMLEVNFAGITSASMPYVTDLRRLKKLDFQTISVSDADLAHVADLTALEWLQLTGKGTTITDEGLACLQGLVRMKMLSIQSPAIGSAGLAHLHDMAGLESLLLPQSRLTDLGPVRHLTGLKGLNLRGAPIDDVGLGTDRELRRH
jgi:hypothetical protein